MKRLTLFIVTVLGLTVSLFGVTATAAESTSPSIGGNQRGQALEIAPPLVNITADPGETVKTQIKLRDVTDVPLVVTGEVNDFVAAGEDGTPKILLEDNPDNPYSIKQWVAPLSQLTLKPQEIKNLPVTIHVPKDASPGGYYGVVRFSATPPKLKDTGVSLSASLGALLFVRVNGDAQENLAIEQFTVTKNGRTDAVFTSTPLDFLVRLKNTGNVQQQPVGRITIKDMFDNKIAAVNVNLDQNNILPESIRKFKSSLNENVIGKKMLFGRYTADLSVSYGSEQKNLTSSVNFWVVPYHLIGLVIALLIGGFFLFRYLIRRYNQHIINKAQKQ